LRFLNQRIDYERSFGLDYTTREFKPARIRELLTRIGDPHLGMPILHVAGTKGKGSTSAMAAAVLTAAGYRTGLFTSPHLEGVEERIAIDGQPCSSRQFAQLLEQFFPALEAMDREGAARTPPEPGPTYFEITTAMALQHFAQRRVAAAVLEVGLGGRLDSTNVCQPLVSVITSISFDHTQQLGNTLEAIAQEKAGIIKQGVPVVSGVTDPGPRAVIRRTCRELGCRLVEMGVDFEVQYTPPHGAEASAATGTIDFLYRGAQGPHRYSHLALGLLGRHQAANAAVALAALAQLRPMGWEIPETAVREGLGRLTWPARVELIARRPAVVIDAAHNVASASALIQVLNESFSARRRVLVFASTQDKDLRGMLGELLGEFDDVILTQYLDNPRAVPVEDLAAAASEVSGRSYRVCPRPADAWDAARELAAAEDLICVTGSFFIAAQMRHEVLARPCGKGHEAVS
jgi:dihydrofolate synthase/folylpolyglutamate synthase